mgnify:FL=1
MLFRSYALRCVEPAECFAKAKLIRGCRPDHKTMKKDRTKVRSFFMAGTEGEVANTSTPVFAITDKTLQAVEKLVDSLEKLGIKYVDGKLVYDEEEAGYEYLQ